MLKKIYGWLHDMTSRPDERGEYSGGCWQDMVRKEALRLCGTVRGRVLEIGCGEGLFLAPLAKENPAPELYGVDNDSGRLIRAEKRFAENDLKNINLSLQEAPNLSFQDEFFDAVVCVNVFFNMPSIEMVKETLARMKRVCTTGGRIIFDFRNSRNLLLTAKYKLARYYDETVKDLPLSTYDPREIERIIKDLNFDVVEKRFIPRFFGSGPRLRGVAPIIMIEARKR